MIKVSKVEETHYWCHCCSSEPKAQGVDLFRIEVDMLVGGQQVEMANFRLCRQCLSQFQQELNEVI